MSWILEEMTVEPLGESALILRDLPMPAYRAADRIRRGARGLLDVVAAYDTLGLYFKGEPPSEADLIAALSDSDALVEEAKHEFPVCYELGEDLAAVSERLAMSVDEVIREHTSVWYRCFAIGFCPGFPYLGELPSRLSGLPRLPAPRVRVEPGSVAITGNQTGIYPMVRPGGWWILGRTPLTLVDVEGDYFPINAGDLVRFHSIDRAEFEARVGERL